MYACKVCGLTNALMVYKQVPGRFRDVQESSGQFLDSRRSGFVPRYEGLGQVIRYSLHSAISFTTVIMDHALAALQQSQGGWRAGQGGS